MSDDKVKHLEFIQNIITRHNTNSFQVKVVSATLVSAIIALYGSDAASKIPISRLGFFIVCIFMWLDCFYLRQERLFRNLYENVLRETVSTFSLSTEHCHNERTKYISVVTSSTILAFYLPMCAVFLTISLSL